MPKAIVYTRVSSREQQQEGFSLGAQANFLREYAERNGFDVVQAFEDVETAKVSGRKNFSEMVSWLKRNRDCRTLLVEKTDRLYRNFHDAVTLEDLDIEIHFVKEGSAVSKDSKSQTRLIQGIHLVMARNYSENLREEVKKGMREKASQGYFPGHAPFGYRNNKLERTIEIDPVDSIIVQRMFELYAGGAHTLTTLARTIRAEFGKRISRSNMHLILKNPFYVGTFWWGGETYAGKHPLIVSPETFREVQRVLGGHNRPKYAKRDVAFRGMMTCAYDGCQLTADVQRQRYIYYRCTGHRGKCALPRFREEDLANRLGDPLKKLQIPLKVVSEVLTALRHDASSASARAAQERSRLEGRLSNLRTRMGKAYEDKLDGAIDLEFWERKTGEWRAEEQDVRMSLQTLETSKRSEQVLDAERIFELANRAYSLYLSQNSTEKAKLLRLLVSNWSVDAVSATPVYRKPFDMIFERAKSEEWSGRLDSN